MIETVAPLALRRHGAVAGAALMLVLRHPMRVALALIATMLSLAGIYALLGVHVIAVFQVLIYVGAVMVFMVYVIMLLDVRDRAVRARFSRLLRARASRARGAARRARRARVWRALPAPRRRARRDALRRRSRSRPTS